MNNKIDFTIVRDGLPVRVKQDGPGILRAHVDAGNAPTATHYLHRGPLNKEGLEALVDEAIKLYRDLQEMIAAVDEFKGERVDG
jgi:hypothetical protein